jgi:excisionase family DNA binding protein
MSESTWLTVAEICERLKVHEETVRRWIRTGQLKARAFGGRTGYRILESDFQEFLEDPEGSKIAA